MSTFNIIRSVVRDIAARRALSTYLAAMGEPPAGMLESLSSLRSRYKAAIVARAEPCDLWEDEIPEGADVCPRCESPTIVHASRCPPDEQGSAFDDFLLRTEGRDECDACGRSQAEHEPGARPKADE